MKKHTMDLTQGPIFQQLILFVIPIFFTQLLQTLYNAADRIVVGQFAGSLALAAVGSTGYAYNLFVTLVVGLATGANVIIANFRGARNHSDMRKAMHASMLLAVVCGFLLAVAGFSISRPLLRLLNTPTDVINLATIYMQINFLGSPFSMVYNFGAAILRAYGDTKRPMMILSISGIANVVLNLIFVVVFHMTVEGVALATIISQAISAVWIVCILFDPKDEYQLQKSELRFYKGITGMIIRSGIPCGINSSLFSFAGLFLQSATNSFGSAVMAGSSASDSITGIVSTLPSSMFTACVSFAGQCYGAGKYKRLDLLLICSSALSGSIVAILAFICTLWPALPLSLFTTDQISIAAGAPKLIMVSWAYVVSCITNCTVGILRGMGKSIPPTIIGVLCLCVVRLLWIWFAFPLNPTPVMLFLCIPISFICNCVGQMTHYLISRRKLHKSFETSSVQQN